MPRINLIPWREAERKQRRQEFTVGAVVALAAAALIAVVIHWQMRSAIDDQNERNQLLTNEIASLDKQIAEILDLEQQKNRLLGRMQVIEQLERSRAEVVHLFDQIVRTLPEGIYLTSIKQNDRKIQLKGVAQSSTRVSNYMRNIEASEWLKDPSLEIYESKGSGDAGAQFTLYAVQTSPGSAAATGGADGASDAAAETQKAAKKKKGAKK